MAKTSPPTARVPGRIDAPPYPAVPGPGAEPFIIFPQQKDFFMRFSSIPLTLACALWSSTALAQATDEGAARLLSVFQTYLGTTEGVVAVAVDGGAYAVTLDAGPLITKIPAEGMTATVTPIKLSVTENGDGTWAYSIDQPVSFAYELPGLMKSSTDYGQVTVSGVFDEALGDTREYSARITDLVTNQTQVDPVSGGETVVKVTQGSLIWEGTAAAGADGVDGRFEMDIGNVAYDITMPAADGMPPMTISATMAEGSAEGTMTGYQPAGLYGLLAFFVAHPDAALIEANKPGLKSAIEAALPVFGNLAMTGGYRTVSVMTPMGPVGLDEVGITVDMNGVVADGKFREAITLKGLTLPEGVLPPFAAPLVPSELTLDVTASRFDLAAAATLGLGLLDLPAGATPPEGFDAQMMAALLPQGNLDITLAPGSATAPGYRLGYQGNMTVGPMMPMPVGKATLSLTGIEAITEALMASPPEMGMQEMVPMLGMAQAMAKPGAEGELLWDIEMTATGGLLINGTNMTGQ